MELEDSGHDSMSPGQSEATIDDMVERANAAQINNNNIEGTRSQLTGYTELEMTSKAEPAEERRKSGDEEEKEEENKKDSEPKLPRRELIRRLIIAASMLIAALLVNSCFSVIAPFYPKEARSRGVNDFLVGFILGVTPLTVALISPIFGYFLPELGVKFLLVAGLALVGGPYILMAFLHELENKVEFLTLSLALRIVEGVGSAAFYTSSFTVATVLFPSSTGTVMGLMELTSALGFLIGPPIGGALYQLGGFRLPFLVAGSSATVFVLIFLAMLPSTETKEKKCLSPKTIFKLMTNFQFLVLLFIVVVAEAGLVFYMPDMAKFMTTSFGFSPFEVGLSFLPLPLSYMLFSILVGQLSDRLGPRWLLCIGLLVVGVLYLFVGPAPFIIPKKLLPLTFICFAGIGAGCSMSIVPVYSDLLRVAKVADPYSDQEKLHGVVSGLISATLFFGEFIGPLMAGAMMSVFSFEMASALFGLGVFAAGLMVSGMSFVDYVIERVNKKALKRKKLKEKKNKK